MLESFTGGRNDLPLLGGYFYTLTTETELRYRTPVALG
ncbi:hypothetical protein [Porphyromonas phage phage019b_ATCC49417]|uniref:Uncharacterized protein n=1 Tax=Porphyromonas phage phage019a_ATCC49417 TaxID=3154109 RepID=A0AAT9J8K6_9VIRU